MAIQLLGYFASVPHNHMHMYRHRPCLHKHTYIFVFVMIHTQSEKYKDTFHYRWKFLCILPDICFFSAVLRNMHYKTLEYVHMMKMKGYKRKGLALEPCLLTAK